MSRIGRRRRNDDDFLFGDDLLGGEPEESAEAIEGSGQAAARLADGSGFLIVDGPGAGSVTGYSAGRISAGLRPCRGATTR